MIPFTRAAVVLIALSALVGAIAGIASFFAVGFLVS